MYRTAIIIAFAVVACGPAAATVDPPEEDAFEPSQEVVPEAMRRLVPGDVAALGTSCAPHDVATSDVPACAGGTVCDADVDCAADPGNYCDVGSCALNGCVRGRCNLTKVQGQACARDGECVSGSCTCAANGGDCVCAPQQGEPDFHGP